MKEAKAKRKLPDDEIVWESYISKSGRGFFITSTKFRDSYNLWEKTSSGYVLIMKADHPPKLKEKIEILIADEDKPKTKRKPRS